MKAFFDDLCEKAKTSSRAFWNYVNNAKCEKSSIPPMLRTDGTLAESDVEKCTILNNQYCSQFIRENPALLYYTPLAYSKH